MSRRQAERVSEWAKIVKARMYDRVFKARRGPAGRRLCYACEQEVPKGRITWCGDACVECFNAEASQTGMRRAVWLRDRGVCQICAVECSDVGRGEDRWEADHIVPICQGGDHVLSNLQTLCRHHHVEKTTAMKREDAQERREEREEEF